MIRPAPPLFARRSVLAMLGALAAAPLAARHLAGSARAASLGRPFSRQRLVDLARQIAGRPHRARPRVPKPWARLTYDEYRDIRFRPERALWRGTARPFEAQFFAPGFFFAEPIAVHVVEDGLAQKVAFDLADFAFGPRVPELPAPSDLGHSGFRIHGNINRADYRDEFAVFQGASYFRAVAKGQAYGLSARGLAIDIAEPSGEEMPAFTDFWLEAPRPGEDCLVVHALLQSQRVAGAYRFDIRPGEITQMEIAATLFARQDLGHVGLAPLTSMFLFDGTNTARFDDFRPRVHDSDGLYVANGAGEWLWRPLANPRTLQVSSFLDSGPAGFGLMQRRRGLGAYADLEARYDNRPSLWVEPRGDWGKGAVVLVEIPSAKEINDNIVAYWRPAAALPAGEAHELAYTLSWCWTPPAGHQLARVAETRGGANPWGGRLIVIDFVLGDGPPLDPTEIVAEANAHPRGILRPPVLQANPDTGGLRLNLGFDPGAASSVDLRAQLRLAGRQASEVWLYRWTA